MALSRRLRHLAWSAPPFCQGFGAAIAITIIKIGYGVDKKTRNLEEIKISTDIETNKIVLISVLIVKTWL